MGVITGIGYLVNPGEYEKTEYLTSIFKLLFKKIVYQDTTYTYENVSELNNLFVKNHHFELSNFEYLYFVYENDDSEVKKLMTIELQDDIIHTKNGFYYKKNPDIKIADVGDVYDSSITIYVTSIMDGSFDIISENTVLDLFAWKRQLVKDNRLNNDVQFGQYGFTI